MSEENSPGTQLTESLEYKGVEQQEIVEVQVENPFPVEPPDDPLVSEVITKPVKAPRSEKQKQALLKARENLNKKRLTKTLEEQSQLQRVQSEINSLLKENETLRNVKHEYEIKAETEKVNKIKKKKKKVIVEESSSSDSDDGVVIEKKKKKRHSSPVKRQHVPATSLMRSFGF